MPKPLFTKLIVQAAVGFFFVLVGCVYGIHFKDYIFIMLSLLIGLCSLIRTYSFYRLIYNRDYLVLSGTCIRQTSLLLKKSRWIVLVDETQREYRLTLDKDSGLLPGHHYRFYLRQSDGLDSGYENYSSTDLLEYEELSIKDE